MEKKVEEIISEIKSMDNNVSNVIVPLLKDSITDYRKIIYKLIAVIIILIFGIIGTAIAAQIIISEQSNKYNDFLSQFEFESTSDEFIQDVDTGDNGTATINDGIDTIK